MGVPTFPVWNNSPSGSLTSLLTTSIRLDASETRTGNATSPGSGGTYSAAFATGSLVAVLDTSVIGKPRAHEVYPNSARSSSCCVVVRGPGRDRAVGGLRGNPNSGRK